MTVSVDERPRTHLVRDALRRRWLLLLGSAVVIGGLTAAMALHGPPHYVASASVFLQPITGNALSPDATVNGQQVTVAMETEAGMVDSPDVVRRVSRRLHLPAADVRARVTASVPTNTKIVRIQFQATDPRAAQDGAQAFAEAFLDFREGLASEAQNRQITKLDAQAHQANASLRRLAKQTGSSAVARRQVLVSRLATLQATIGQLNATDVHPGTISSPARLPAAPAGIPPMYLMALGVMAGLALGLVAAVGWESADDRVRTATGMSLAGLPVLSVLAEPQHANGVLAQRAVEGMEGESYRQLRVGISATVPEARTICVCDAELPGDAARHVVNLAVVMSRAGLQVAAVDATGDEEMVGLIREQLLGDVRSDEGARLSVGGKKPVVVVSASEQAGQVSYVDEERLALLLMEQRRRADHVLVAAPSLMTSDGEVAGLAAECVLLVVEQRKTRTRDIERLADRARVLGISFCGVFSVPRRHRPRRTRQRLGEPLRDPLPELLTRSVGRALGAPRVGEAGSGS